jgi:hypothetical protein
MHLRLLGRGFGHSICLIVSFLLVPIGCMRGHTGLSTTPPPQRRAGEEPSLGVPAGSFMSKKCTFDGFSLVGGGGWSAHPLLRPPGDNFHHFPKVSMVGSLIHIPVRRLKSFWVQNHLRGFAPDSCLVPSMSLKG